MWASCFALIGKNGHIRAFRLQQMRNKANLDSVKFFKNICSYWKKRDSGAHVLWGESIARGDEYGKEQPLQLLCGAGGWDHGDSARKQSVLDNAVLRAAEGTG